MTTMQRAGAYSKRSTAHALKMERTGSKLQPYFKTVNPKQPSVWLCKKLDNYSHTHGCLL